MFGEFWGGIISYILCMYTYDLHIKSFYKSFICAISFFSILKSLSDNSLIGFFLLSNITDVGYIYFRDLSYEPLLWAWLLGMVRVSGNFGGVRGFEIFMTFHCVK